MARLLRCAFMIKGLQPTLSNAVLNKCRTHISRHVYTRYDTSLASQAANVFIEKSIFRDLMDSYRRGEVNENVIRSALKEAQETGSLHEKEACLLMRSMIGSFTYLPVESRKNLIDESWELIKNLGSPTLNVYNSMLECSLANNIFVNPVDIIMDMEANNITPNAFTLQEVVGLYCLEGDIEGASRVIEHMKSLNWSLTETEFAHLVRGHWLNGDKEKAEEVWKSAIESGVQLRHRLLRAHMCGYASAGEKEHVFEMLEQYKENGSLGRSSLHFDLAEIFAQSEDLTSFGQVLNLIKIPDTPYSESFSRRLLRKLVASNRIDAAVELQVFMFKNYSMRSTSVMLSTMMLHDQPVDSVMRVVSILQSNGMQCTAKYCASIARQLEKPHYIVHFIDELYPNMQFNDRINSVLPDFYGPDLDPATLYANASLVPRKRLSWKSGVEFLSVIINKLLSLNVEVEEIETTLRENIKREQISEAFVLAYVRRSDFRAALGHVSGMKDFRSLFTFNKIQGFDSLEQLTDCVKVFSVCHHFANVKRIDINQAFFQHLILLRLCSPTDLAVLFGRNGIPLWRGDNKEFVNFLVDNELCSPSAAWGWCKQYSKAYVPRMKTFLRQGDLEKRLDIYEVGSEAWKNAAYNILPEYSALDLTDLMRRLRDNFENLPEAEKTSRDRLFLVECELLLKGNPETLLRYLEDIMSVMDSDPAGCVINSSLFELFTVLLTDGAHNLDIVLKSLNTIAKSLQTQETQFFPSSKQTRYHSDNLVKVFSSLNIPLEKRETFLRSLCSVLNPESRTRSLSTFFAKVLSSTSPEEIIRIYEFLQEKFNFTCDVMPFFCILIHNEDTENLKRFMEFLVSERSEQSVLNYLIGACIEMGKHSNAKTLINEHSVVADNSVMDAVASRWLRRHKVNLVCSLISVASSMEGFNMEAVRDKLVEYSLKDERKQTLVTVTQFLQKHALLPTGKLMEKMNIRARKFENRAETMDKKPEDLDIEDLITKNLSTGSFASISPYVTDKAGVKKELAVKIGNHMVTNGNRSEFIRFIHYLSGQQAYEVIAEFRDFFDEEKAFLIRVFPYIRSMVRHLSKKEHLAKFLDFLEEKKVAHIFLDASVISELLRNHPEYNDRVFEICVSSEKKYIMNQFALHLLRSENWEALNRLNKANDSFFKHVSLFLASLSLRQGKVDLYEKFTSSVEPDFESPNALTSCLNTLLKATSLTNDELAAQIKAIDAQYGEDTVRSIFSVIITRTLTRRLQDVKELTGFMESIGKIDQTSSTTQ